MSVDIHVLAHDHVFFLKVSVVFFMMKMNCEPTVPRNKSCNRQNAEKFLARMRSSRSAIGFDTR
jgi:hypothetical protein